MQFASINFFCFFLFAILGYYLFPKKNQYIFVFITNIIYYVSWVTNCKYIIPLGVVIVISYLGAIILHRLEGKTIVRKIVLAMTIFLTLTSLLLFKYGNFLIDNLNAAIPQMNISHLHFIQTVGLSFFSLQALGYVVDVYKQKTKVEYNIIRYMAFVSFFATVSSGPIERSDHLLLQLRDEEGITLDWHNLYSGLLWFVYGVFLKLCIADRLSVLVNTVYGSYKSYGGGILFSAAIAYSIEIYCDFEAYSLMALGLGKMLGIELIDNFDTPYFATTVQDFWRRWHISLSTWFRDYVYIPLGGNRCSKFRKYMNLLITFLVSGLWHGADWTFVIWGGMHGLFQIIGDATKKIRNKLFDLIGINTECFSFKLSQRIIVFVLITFAWIFFRADTLEIAVGYIQRIFAHPELWGVLNGDIYNLGLDNLQMNLLWIGLLIMVVVDVYRYKTGNHFDEFLIKQNVSFNILVIVSLLVSILVFGMYGSSFDSQSFIYFQF
ncbi:MAG: MBOAT family protein [Lachnospiraceae bacterium]|nr:MBOAT family protein [Lachnospiraceae bacterium]